MQEDLVRSRIPCQTVNLYIKGELGEVVLLPWYIVIAGEGS